MNTADADLVLSDSNTDQTNCSLVVNLDNMQSNDYVCLTMLCNEEVQPINPDGTEHHFRINKQQAIFLADYLKRAYELMS